MGRSAFLGRQAVVARLLNIAKAGKLGQPFLMVGPEGSGKENTALEFARLLNCAEPTTCGPASLCESCVKALSFQHPDIRWIGPAPATIKEAEIQLLFKAKVEHPFYQSPGAATSFVSIGDSEHPGPMTLRSLIHFLRKRAFQGRYKVAIVADAQRMNNAAANAFLKTLEEPPEQTVIMMLTTGATGMLPTILSRCQEMRFDPWPEAELTQLLQDVGRVPATDAQAAARIADGNARRGLALLQPEARLLAVWAVQLFDWIQQGNKAMAAISADELHRGDICHACCDEENTQKKMHTKEASHRRDRATQFCELLNLVYSDVVNCRELGEQWRPRLAAGVEVVRRAAASRQTESLLADMANIEASRRDVERNINIGLSMAVLFEELINRGQSDRTVVAHQA